MDCETALLQDSALERLGSVEHRMILAEVIVSDFRKSSSHHCSYCPAKTQSREGVDISMNHGKCCRASGLQLHRNMSTSYIDVKIPTRKSIPKHGIDTCILTCVIPFDGVMSRSL